MHLTKIRHFVRILVDLQNYCQAGVSSARNIDMTYKNDDFSRLEINLPGCLENYKYFRSKLQDTTRLLVLVKANAYGHGAVEFASLMLPDTDYMMLLNITAVICILNLLR